MHFVLLRRQEPSPALPHDREGGTGFLPSQEHYAFYFPRAAATPLFSASKPTAPFST